VKAHNGGVCDASGQVVDGGPARRDVTAADVIVKGLEAQGVEYLFGIPGGAIEPLNNALSRSGIRAIVAKHEGGAAFMADGYARVGGRLGVCCGTSGPGATNLLTGVASAYGDSVPVVALSGQVATSLLGKGAVQEFHLQSFGVVGMYRPVTKYSDAVINESKAADMIAKACRTALTGRKGPVHLNLPADIMKRNIPASDRSYSITETRGFDREQVREAALRLLSARRPVILAGWGATLAQADRELAELAEMLDIPVATSPKGKGIFSELHGLSLGPLGYAGSGCAWEYIAENDVDVMLAVGTSFNEFVTLGWDRKMLPSGSLIQIDIDPDEIGKNFYVQCGVAGDAKVALRELLYELKRRMPGSASRLYGDPRSEIRRLKEKYRLPCVCGPETPLKPQRLIERLQESLPADSIYMADTGNCTAWAIHCLKIHKPYTFYIPLGFASMGYAMAASIGAKLAVPDRPVIALVGDGGFLMNGMEVATAVDYNIPVIWVVMNNAMLGMIYHGRRLAGLPEGIGSRFKRVDIAAVAEGLGARAFRISSPGEITREFMDEIIASGAPALLDVIIDADEIPPIQSRISALEKLYN
jgi:acetolactate synthase-1/2/3 large subunit